MKSAKKFNVQGTVNDMFYSQFILDSANKYKLVGYMRHLQDGNVEILVEGDDLLIKDFERELKIGPKHSHVRNIKTEIKKWSGEFKGFKILKF